MMIEAYDNVIIEVNNNIMMDFVIKKDVIIEDMDRIINVVYYIKVKVYGIKIMVRELNLVVYEVKVMDNSFKVEENFY